MYPTSKGKPIIGSKIISLNKIWNFKTDSDNIGLEENWHLKENFKATESRTIKVPSCWEEEFEDFEDNHDYSNLTYQFCTECVIEGDSLDKKELKSKIMEIGDSVVTLAQRKKLKSISM